jgi:hypothetical protein
MEFLLRSADLRCKEPMEYVQIFGSFIWLAAYTPRRHSALFICLFCRVIEVASAPFFCLSWPRRRGGYATSEENSALRSNADERKGDGRIPAC